MRFDPSQPFVLIDDARAQGSRGARLFADPAEIIVAETADAVMPALRRLEEAVARGRWAAGFLAYEAGHAIEPRLMPLARPAADGLPLLWFGLFDRCHHLMADELLSAAAAGAMAAEPMLDADAYRAMVARVQDYIAAGDVYQVNLTFPAEVAIHGHPLALYRRLRGAQAAPHGALIHLGGRWVLSFSPELFFTLEAGRLTTRPMKGTAARAPTLDADRAIAAALAADAKNRAENLMIVDLLRNDLSRVAVPGSVAVDGLFTVETYPTVHQMTTTVTARLRPGLTAVDALRHLFPCGSVTGAPKIRAMEIIAEVEPAPRGLYTGSIGWLSPEGDAAFNVAIRTLVLQQGGRATLGLGSGIVADSEADAEWRECATKAAFVARRARHFDLIETLRFTPGEGFAYLDRHLARLTASAAYWNFAYDAAAARAALDAAVVGATGPTRVRLLLGPSGVLTVQTAPLGPSPEGPVEVGLASCPIASDDPRLFHKTTDRRAYDEARAHSGRFELLFVNAEGKLCEGSFTNLFVPRGGRLLTPPLSAGLLPGVLRAELLARGEAVEAELAPSDLEGGFYIGNALRGLMKARLASLSPSFR